MTSVAVYHRTVPNAKNQEKIDLLKNYATGVRSAGDVCYDNNTYQYQPTDVGVIQGWLGGGNISTPHLRLRNTVINNQINSKKHVVVVDSNLFLYTDTENPLHYLRYSFNGVFPNTGIYFDAETNPNRWQSISKNLNLTLKDYRSTGNHILLCLQRNGGWSMDGYDVQTWTIDTIKKLRAVTDRPIIIRGHPNDSNAKRYLDPKNPECKIRGFTNVFFSEFGRSLEQDLVNCWAVVNHNSSPTVGAAIEGYPVFVSDPERSQCRIIANTDLSKIENPDLPDRQTWIEKISMSHWNFDELRSGEAWAHMRNYCQ